ncbi:universal stress protein [Halorubrum sp. DTA98]|uniref:universal stress protein n=1 Tax=Halorubrum sp. DTA98 TaxID=3402163 RepID=UPI003AAB3484
MYTILMAVGGEREPAGYAAEAVANYPGEPTEKQVTLLNVQREFETPDEGEPVSSEDIYDASTFPASVDAAMEVLEEAGIPVTKRREHGDPASTVLDVAEEIDADAIVLGSRNRSPAGKALFGSVTQSVILDSDLPVTVVSRD